MATDSMDAYTWFRNRVEHADTDLLRSMVTTFAEALMDAEADALCGAAYGERSGERINSRNGYRERQWDTRAGSTRERTYGMIEGPPLQWSQTSIREAGSPG